MQGLVGLCMDSGLWVKWEALKVLSRGRMQCDIFFPRNPGRAMANRLKGAVEETELDRRL